MNAKRVFDVVLSAVALILLSPVLAITTCAIVLESRGPVLFTQVRIGLHGKPFRIIKFRTMFAGSTHHRPNVSPAGDPRITRVGAILRRTALDEAPQLLNVLVGDMSLVGPRPETPEYVAQYTEEELRVLTVKPGMAGPSTLAFKNEPALLAKALDPSRYYLDHVMHERVRCDLEYLEGHTLRYDLSVLIRTALTLFAPTEKES